MLTDGLYNGNVPSNTTISEYPVYYRVIDLTYLFNISEKSHIPIEIDFEQEGYQVPCITIPIENEQYKSYLAIIPGKLLAAIYERYGSRLLEQNVRSFLQFTGNINKGIRSTIQSEPEMFLAYNNGIAATAEETVIKQAKNGQGLYISKIKDLQIVNGGQTTASIFHTLKKDRADISGIFVQLKLTVVKDRTNFSQIVSNISRYANTQNKVSVSDLSANHSSFIQLEKLSRLIYAPHVAGNSTQTRWFFERARGQYKNERAREGRTKAKLRAFESQNPRKQLFTKEDVAKYLNSYSEVIKGNKIVIGPHIVVRGSQKNHKAFVDYNLPGEIDSIYFEDVVAKMIIFRAAEKVYGVKPNAIGDLRFITVPYAISYMVYVLKHSLDLYKIWKEQDISERMKDELRTIMVRVEDFIKTNAPGSLYTEFAKKEECWSSLKASRIGFDISALEDEIIDPQNPPKRRKMNPEQLNHMEEHYLLNQIILPTEKWKEIIQWGQQTEKLNLPQLDRIHNYLEKQDEKIKITEEEVLSLIEIIERVNKYAPEILEDMNEQEEKTQEQIFIEQACHCLEWIKATKHGMNPIRYGFIKDITKGKIPYTFENETILAALKKDLIEFGYQLDENKVTENETGI
jgi:hypothetical protein